MSILSCIGRKARHLGQIYVFIAITITPIILYVLFYTGPQEIAYEQLLHLEKRINVALPPETESSELHFISESASSEGGKGGDLRKLARRQGCIIPNLKLRDPDLAKFYKKMDPVSCGEGAFDWVSLRNGQFSITPEAKKKYGDDISCRLTPLKRITDFDTREDSVVLEDVKHGSMLQHDFYKVECTAKDGSKYTNYQAGIKLKPEAAQRKSVVSTKGLDLDVIIIGHDSLSRMAWMRHLPLTWEYLVKELKVIEMKGETVVGDGTPATMFPLLTGKREEELPEARKGYPNAKPVDDFPWIWRDFQKAGYVTAWQEDEPNIGTFHYRLKGFDREPTDHYYRQFLVLAEKYFRKSPPGCLGAKPRIVTQNDYMADVLDVYKGQGKRKWIMSFKSENSHNDNNRASMLDVHLRDHLKELHEKRHLDNAMLIMFADHGARFSNVRAFAQGKLEERMPYLAIRMPASFNVTHPELMRNLKLNSRRLTTPFDLHETLHEVLHFTGTGPADISKRGVSLFKEIPIERDCKSANVDSHWCYCMDWQPVPVENELVQNAAGSVLDLINRETSSRRELCSQLVLKVVKSASQIKVKDDILKFKDTNDGGRGRFGKMTDNTKDLNIKYQVTFETSPNNGLYEATLSYDVNTKSFRPNLTGISRINRYGNDPWCIVKSIPQLRPYCHCVTPSLSSIIQPKKSLS